jgi:hypothetical protein
MTAGAAIAAAQTVMVRNAPPGTAIEILLNDAVVGTETAAADGLATLDLKMPEPGEMDANVYVDVCEKSRRVLVVDRNKRPPSPPAGCERREVSGLFLVRRINTLVVDVGALQPSMLLVKGSYTPPKPVVEGEEEAAAPRRPSPTGLSLFAAGGVGKFRDATEGTAVSATRSEGPSGSRAGWPRRAATSSRAAPRSRAATTRSGSTRRSTSMSFRWWPRSASRPDPSAPTASSDRRITSPR